MILRVLAFLGFALLASMPTHAAMAQGCGTNNPNCIVPTRPVGDNTNAAASTAFVASNSAPSTVSVLGYGAKCDGSTDDHAAVTAALNSGNATVYIPNSQCYVATAITVPDYVTLSGVNYQPNTGGVRGSVILCNYAIHGPCVVGGAQDTKPLNINNLTIARNAGAVPSDGECLQIPGGQDVHIDRVECFNHASGFEVDNLGAGSIGVWFNNVHTCKISGSHFVVSGAPGVYVAHSWLGCNGAYDVASNNFVKITGNWDATQGTVHFTDTQFNQGQNAATCAFDFESFTGSTNQMLDFEVIGGHEETAQKGICTDSTVAGLQFLQIVGLWMGGGWGGANALFALNPATKPFFWSLVGDSFTGWTSATLAPTGGFDTLAITGSNFPGTPLSITAGTNSLIDLEGNTYQGLTLAGAFNFGSKVTGVSRGGSYTYGSGIGPVEIDIPQESWAPCTMALAFGGSSAGITTSSNSCKWQLHGSVVTVSWSMNLTSKGAASGSATLTGLPLTVGPTLSMAPMYGSNMSGVGSGWFSTAAPGTTSANLYLSGSTGNAVMTDTNFTNNSSFGSTLSYPLTN